MKRSSCCWRRVAGITCERCVAGRSIRPAVVETPVGGGNARPSWKRPTVVAKSRSSSRPRTFRFRAAAGSDHARPGDRRRVGRVGIDRTPDSWAGSAAAGCSRRSATPTGRRVLAAQGGQYVWENAHWAAANQGVVVHKPVTVPAVHEEVAHGARRRPWRWRGSQGTGRARGTWVDPWTHYLATGRAGRHVG